MSERRAVRYAELGAALRQARETAGHLSGKKFAAGLGWGQAKVSLIETGRQMPSPADIDAWAATTGADGAWLHHLRETAASGDFDLLAAARANGGQIVGLQKQLEWLELRSTTLYEFQPRMVPGPLQTEAYTRAWLTHPARPSWVGRPGAEQIARDRETRRDSLVSKGVAITACMESVALTAAYGDPDALIEQVSFLRQAARSGLAEVLVLPDVAPLLHGFELLDDTLLLESEQGLRVHSDPERVQAWRETAQWLRKHAVPVEEHLG